jgi:hypothetical protein
MARLVSLSCSFFLSYISVPGKPFHFSTAPHRSVVSMSTRIRFSGQAQEVAAYYPGDIIDGIVYLRGPLQDSNLAVSIKLVGSTHSTIFLGKHSVDHDLVLCEVRQELYVGPCSLEKGEEMSWPVGIQVPQHTYNYDGHSKSRH